MLNLSPAPAAPAVSINDRTSVKLYKKKFEKETVYSKKKQFNLFRKLAIISVPEKRLLN